MSLRIASRSSVIDRISDYVTWGVRRPRRRRSLKLFNQSTFEFKNRTAQEGGSARGADSRTVTGVWGARGRGAVGAACACWSKPRGRGRARRRCRRAGTGPSGGGGGAGSPAAAGSRCGPETARPDCTRPGSEPARRRTSAGPRWRSAPCLRRRGAGCRSAAAGAGGPGARGGTGARREGAGAGPRSRAVTA